MTEAEWLYIQSRVVPDGDCLIWPGATGGDKKTRYAIAQIGGKLRLIHREVWQYFHPNETLPPGRPPRGTPRMVVAHSCNRSLCLNPEHLQLELHRKNLLDRPNDNSHNRNKTHCDRGHDLSTAYITSDGRRDCKECRADREAERKAAGFICSVAGCETVVGNRGMCRKHYERWRKHGDPTIVFDRYGRRKEK